MSYVSYVSCRVLPYPDSLLGAGVDIITDATATTTAVKIMREKKLNRGVAAPTRASQSTDPWEETTVVWQCEFPGCTYCVCADCGNDRISLSHQIWKYIVSHGPFYVIGVALAMYVPVVDTTLKIVSCNVVYECAFEKILTSSL